MGGDSQMQRKKIHTHQYPSMMRVPVRADMIGGFLHPWLLPSRHTSSSVSPHRTFQEGNKGCDKVKQSNIMCKHEHNVSVPVEPAILSLISTETQQPQLCRFSP